MKIIALKLAVCLLFGATLLLTGCAPMPYQGCYERYPEVIIIHDPGPPPCYPPPRLPVDDRHVPLVKDRYVREDKPRTKEPVQGRPPRQPVTKPSRDRGEPNPVRVAERSPRRSPRTR